MIRTKLVAVNENGRRIGEDHPRAKLTNHEVDLIRQLIEDRSLPLREIARKFECSEATVRSISCYRRRVQTPAGSKRVTVPAGPAPDAWAPQGADRRQT